MYRIWCQSGTHWIRVWRSCSGQGTRTPRSIHEKWRVWTVPPHQKRPTNCSKLNGWRPKLKNASKMNWSKRHKTSWEPRRCSAIESTLWRERLASWKHNCWPHGRSKLICERNRKRWDIATISSSSNCSRMVTPNARSTSSYRSKWINSSKNWTWKKNSNVSKSQTSTRNFKTPS